mmetsp:Transcript_17130/g.28626  ORF Transcript_17130/g.28626 Transcript_17130/m.28626 type:complete len:268 (+) Transcript_17130:142-945(+)
MFTLLDDIELDTLALGQSNLALILVTNDKHVLRSGRKGVASGIADNGNIKRTRVLLNVRHDADTARVSTLGDHAHVTGLELKGTNNLASSDVHLDGIIRLDKGVRVTDGTTIMGDNHRDLLQGDVTSVDSAKLELLLLIGHAMKDEAALGIVYKTESISGLGHLNDIHETSGEVGVGANLAINRHQLLHADHLGLLASESILQAVSQDEYQREALTEFMGSLRGSGSPDTVHLGEHPMLGRIQTLQMLLRSSCHVYNLINQLFSHKK